MVRGGKKYIIPSVAVSSFWLELSAGSKYHVIDAWDTGCFVFGFKDECMHIE
jgi:hypothetical protein